MPAWWILGVMQRGNGRSMCLRLLVHPLVGSTRCNRHGPPPSHRQPPPTHPPTQDGNHRLSREQDLQLMCRLLEQLMRRVLESSPAFG